MWKRIRRRFIAAQRKRMERKMAAERKRKYDRMFDMIEDFRREMGAA